MYNDRFTHLEQQQAMLSSTTVLYVPLYDCVYVIKVSRHMDSSMSSSTISVRGRMKSSGAVRVVRSCCKCRANNTMTSGAKRRMRLLDEFLRREHARQQTNARQEPAPQDPVLEMTLSDDVLFKIFILLPAESLSRSQFVCKKWFGLINASVFIRSQIHHSETVLICKKLTLIEPPRSYLHFLDLNNGENRFIESEVANFEIRASFDGLLLAVTENGKSLILMNPVTRKHVTFPFGVESGNLFESFGITFCDKSKTYKVVCLCKKSGRITCKILRVSTREWTSIEGPRPELSIDIRQIPVSVGGSLYWMSSEQGCDHFVSMDVHEEKFISKKLPIEKCSKDRLMEIGGNLGFLSYGQGDLLQVWILISKVGLEEVWTKKYSVDLSVFLAFPIAICCSRSGRRMVLAVRNELYVYDSERGEMELIRSTSDDEVWFERIFHEYIPHRNTLASWEDRLEDLETLTLSARGL